MIDLTLAQNLNVKHRKIYLQYYQKYEFRFFLIYFYYKKDSSKYSQTVLKRRINKEQYYGCFLSEKRMKYDKSLHSKLTLKPRKRRRKEEKKKEKNFFLTFKN